MDITVYYWTQSPIYQTILSLLIDSLNLKQGDPRTTGSRYATCNIKARVDLYIRGIRALKHVDKKIKNWWIWNNPESIPIQFGPGKKKLQFWHKYQTSTKWMLSCSPNTTPLVSYINLESGYAELHAVMVTIGRDFMFHCTVKFTGLPLEAGDFFQKNDVSDGNRTGPLMYDCSFRIYRNF